MSNKENTKHKLNKSKLSKNRANMRRGLTTELLVK